MYCSRVKFVSSTVKLLQFGSVALMFVRSKLSGIVLVSRRLGAPAASRNTLASPTLMKGLSFKGEELRVSSNR